MSFKGKKWCFIVFFLMSCSGNHKNYSGNFIEEESYNAIKENKTTKQELYSMLGSPSFTSSVDKDLWYYHSDTRQKLVTTKILDNKTIRISFSGDVVKDKKIFFGKYCNKIDQEKISSDGVNDSKLANIIRNFNKFGNKPSVSPM